MTIPYHREAAGVWTPAHMEFEWLSQCSQNIKFASKVWKSSSNPPIPNLQCDHLIFPTHLLILSYPNLILEKTKENQHGEPPCSPMAVQAPQRSGNTALALEPGTRFLLEHPGVLDKTLIWNCLLKAALIYNICVKCIYIYVYIYMYTSFVSYVVCKSPEFVKGLFFYVRN